MVSIVCSVGCSLQPSLAWWTFVVSGNDRVKVSWHKERFKEDAVWNQDKHLMQLIPVSAKVNNIPRLLHVCVWRDGR